MPRTQNIVICIEGSIGDTCAVLPLISAVKRHFHDRQVGVVHFGQGSKISESIVMGGIPLADFWLTYPQRQRPKSCLGKFSQRVRHLAHKIALFTELRKKNVGTLVFCYQLFTYSERTAAREIRRIRRFARIAGIRQILALPEVSDILPLSGNKNITDRIAVFLKKEGISVENLSEFNFPLSPREQEDAEILARNLPIPPGTSPIAVCIGGKSECNFWSIEHWKETLKKLYNELNVFPIFFDAHSNEPKIRGITKYINIPTVFISEKNTPSLKVSAALMQSACKLYLGHDTGILHLAALAGLPIVGIYSAHDHDGLWFPLKKSGTRNVILRKKCACEGCGLSVCNRKNFCIRAILPDEVFAAAESTLHSL